MLGVLGVFRKRVINPEAFKPRALKTTAKKVLDNPFVPVLEKEVKNFFPESGQWYSTCYSAQKNDLFPVYLPCHLRDTAWMSQLWQKQLAGKGLIIPQVMIQNFMDTAESFATLRHEYELKVVHWQINWMMQGGDGWLMPDGFDETSLAFSPDVDRMIRGGVIKTLTTIGMNADVVEEGLEKFADDWRLSCMQRSFRHMFEPPKFIYDDDVVENLAPADPKHRANWLADREYQYYQEHRETVDKYGALTPAMRMTPEEYSDLNIILAKQNLQRTTMVNQWRKNLCHQAWNAGMTADLTKPSTDEMGK